MTIAGHGLSLRWSTPQQQLQYGGRLSTRFVVRAAIWAGHRRRSYTTRPQQSRANFPRASTVGFSPRSAKFKCDTCHISVRRHYASSTSRLQQISSKSSASSEPTKSSKGPATDLAVLGSGITGLATALAAARNIPNCKVTIYEKTDRLGGWVRSTKVDVGDGEVTFESGPRSLRPAGPNGELSLRLIQSLDMLDELLITPKSSPSAKNRFIYYPDHLVHMPGPGQRIFDVLRALWSEPAFKGAFRSLFRGIITNINNSNVKDESLGAYVSKRLGHHISHNCASALCHGIYAGDVWQLSAKELAAGVWAQENKFGDLWTSFLFNTFAKTSWRFCDDVELLMELQEGGLDPEFRVRMQDCSVFAFKGGIQALIDGLARKLRSMDNVIIKTGSTVSAMSTPNSLGKINITSTGCDLNVNNHSQHSHVISTLPAHVTSSLITKSASSVDSGSDYKIGARDADGLKALAATKATNVAVVNFYFRTPSLLRKVSPPGGLPQTLGEAGLQGFGYLIPQSVPFEQNPERALGVIFDSDITPDIATSVPQDKLGTRLTVMLGGHWWDGWESLPSEPEAISMAQSILARHLGIDEDPVFAQATIQESCIPQYTVGHGERMASAHNAIQSLYNGRLKVAGSWYTGVGVNDCIRAARDIIKGMQRNDARERTGLERFAWGRPLVMVQMKPHGVLEVLKVDEIGARQGYFRGVKVEESNSNGVSK